ncbi:MAG: thiamine pyrophosphate-binding protein [Cellulosilyticaceae bacterium]
MKLSDYVMEFIAKLGVKHIFYVSGGGAMHLNDSLGKNPNIEGICMLHEQGAAISAEAYARISENYGVCLVTSGPGGTNAITGLAGAYYDATPVIFISGQVKREDLVQEQHIRQFGIQETDIVSIAKPISKYAVQIKKAEDVRYELEKASAIAMQGKPGPVWIDIPLDIQAIDVDVKQLKTYSNEETREYSCKDEDIQKTIELFNASKRPLLILGNGIRLSGGIEKSRELYNLLNIPVMTSWNGVDLIEGSHSLFYGRPGAVGHRHANFIQQNADFVLTIGTRLNLLATGYNFDSFLEKAQHVMVEIDENEMKKKSVNPTLAINCDAKQFIEALLDRKDELNTVSREEWITYCNTVSYKYPIFTPEQNSRKGFVSTYKLVNEISEQMVGDDIYQFTSSGTSVDIAMKVFKIKKGQRAFLTKGLAAMGYDIPACIGSCIASGGKRTVCVTGDGSFVMNMQELEIIKRLKLPIKIFVADNNGYSMIYGSQNGNFKGHLTGCTAESGLTIPNIEAISNAFGIETCTIDNENELYNKIRKALTFNGPVVCIVKTDIEQKILPKQANYMKEDGQMASRSLEDMSPILDRAEFESNFIK